MATKKPAASKLTTAQRIEELERRVAAVEGVISMSGPRDSAVPVRAADAPTGAASDPGRMGVPSYNSVIPGRVGPGLVTMHGITFELREPIAADWVPPTIEGVLGGAASAGGQRKLDDPSNGWRVGMPLRSAAGYPIHYPVTRDANGRDVAAGHGMIYYAGQPFESDGAIAEFKAKTGSQFGNPPPTPAYQGEFGVWTLSQQDKVYLAQMESAYREATGKEISHDGIIAGQWEHIASAMHEGRHHHKQGTVNMQAYSSPLKDVVEKRMAEASK